jgi:hypothetical protein
MHLFTFPNASLRHSFVPLPFHLCAPASEFLTLHLASARLLKRMVPFYLSCECPLLGTELLAEV